jgi:cytochrome c oxidase assembly protein subunit 15
MAMLRLSIGMFQLQDVIVGWFIDRFDLVNVSPTIGLDKAMVGGTPLDLPLRHRLALLASHLVVALVALVAIGGATRVMEAGLACPDWPLCYGRFLPGQQMNLQVFLEWFHRLDAFVVGVALLVLSGFSLWRRQHLPVWLPTMACMALVLVAVQGGLGALTVSHLLAAPMVTAHLATALLLVALVSTLYQVLAVTSVDKGLSVSIPRWWIGLAGLSLVLVFSQCLLGAGMASQWAADQCLAVGDGCQWLLAHRQLATPAALSVGLLALSSLTLPRGITQLKALAWGGAALVVLQIVLGVSTLRLQLQQPLVTVAHQVVAALLVGLLASVLTRSLLGSPSADASGPNVSGEWARG